MVLRVTRTMPYPIQTKTIILIDISAENYSFSTLYHKIIELISGTPCPCCRSTDRFKRHGKYAKYHYTKELLIVRVKCEACGKTHAVIPSFSLPGTSVGTSEVEQYLREREKGNSRRKAASVFRGLGVSETYPRQIETMLRCAVDKAKALFPDKGDEATSGYRWLRSVVGPDEVRPLWRLNTMSLASGLNPIFFSRTSLLVLRRKKAGALVSHNTGTVQVTAMPIDSS